MVLKGRKTFLAAYSGSHVAEGAAEQGEDVTMQHELHLVFVDLFLFQRTKRKYCNYHQGAITHFNK